MDYALRIRPVPCERIFCEHMNGSRNCTYLHSLKWPVGTNIHYTAYHHKSVTYNHFEFPKAKLETRNNFIEILFN